MLQMPKALFFPNSVNQIQCHNRDSFRPLPIENPYSNPANYLAFPGEALQIASHLPRDRVPRPIDRNPARAQRRQPSGPAWDAPMYEFPWVHSDLRIKNDYRYLGDGSGF